jgi:hypothetical protein
LHEAYQLKRRGGKPDKTPSLEEPSLHEAYQLKRRGGKPDKTPSLE